MRYFSGGHRYLIKNATITSLLVIGPRKKLRLFLYSLVDPETSDYYFATHYWSLKKVTIFRYSLLGPEKGNELSLLFTGPLKNVSIISRLFTHKKYKD